MGWFPHHPDQMAVMPGRFSFSDVRRPLNIQYHNHGPKCKSAIISLDAEKFFYQIQRGYVMAALIRFGLGENSVY